VINLLITDDDLEVADSLKRNLDGKSNINVAYIASSGQEALELVKKHAIDIVLMDLSMPTMDGIEASQLIKQINPQIKIIILTTFSLEDKIISAIKTNCSGYILKGHKSDKVISIINSVYDGFTVYDQEVQLFIENQINRKGYGVIDKSELRKLTDNEIDFVTLVTVGKTDNEIAEMLFIAPGHVRNTLGAIRDKLNMRNSKELAVWGARMGLWGYDLNQMIEKRKNRQ
jgi:DNA-binding NarL/FixJ family response regulator